MKKNIFILGASDLQLPAIKEAQKMGLRVGVADYNPNAVGVKFADKFYAVSTNDPEGIVNACRDFNADGIMTIATDMPMRTIAKVGEQLSLPAISYTSAVKATDKGKMMETFHEHDVPAPWFKILDSKEAEKGIPASLELPYIIKPVDSSGSRGVYLVRTQDEVKDALAYSLSASKIGQVIVEEYLKGDEISVETITISGATHVVAITDKITTGAPYFVELGHTQPSKFDATLRPVIEKVAVEAVSAIGIKNGPSHIEMKVYNGKPKLIELGARLGGDSITSYLTPLSTGVSMIHATILLALGEVPDINRKFSKAAAIRYIQHNRAGVIRSVSGVEQARTLPNVREVVITRKPGTTIDIINNSINRIGYVITQADTVEDAVKCCEKAVDSINVTIE